MPGKNARVRLEKHLPARDEKAMEINRADVAELGDARDLKSLDGNVVWVRVPPPAPEWLLGNRDGVALNERRNRPLATGQTGASADLRKHQRPSIGICPRAHKRRARDFLGSLAIARCFGLRRL